jgi:hypothetical protein
MAETTIADVMRAHAADAVAFAERRFKIKLDYSEGSLVEIDRILTDRARAGLVVPSTLTIREEDELWVFCKMLGGYVGEVIIRNIGGTWQLKDIDSSSSSVHLLVAGRTEGSPPQAIWRTLTEPYRSIVSYYRTLNAILGQGEKCVEDGVEMVRLPPLSDRPPDAEPARKRRPWWKFR